MMGRLTSQPLEQGPKVGENGRWGCALCRQPVRPQSPAALTGPVPWARHDLSVPFFPHLNIRYADPGKALTRAQRPVRAKKSSYHDAPWGHRLCALFWTASLCPGRAWHVVGLNAEWVWREPHTSNTRWTASQVTTVLDYEHHDTRLRGYDKSRCDPLGADRKSGRLSQQWVSYSGKTLGTLLFQFQKWRKKVFNTIGLVSKPYF